jgi:hypothetical protein
VRAIEARVSRDDDAATSELLPLLDDDAPVVWHGQVVEVRDVARHAIAKLLRRRGQPWRSGPVAHRRPLRPTEALVGARKLGERVTAERDAIAARVRRCLDSRVQPSDADLPYVMAQRTMVELGDLPTVVEPVSAQTWRTPMEEVRARSAIHTVLSLPFLRLTEPERPDLVLGWVYRAGPDQELRLDTADPFDPADLRSIEEEVLAAAARRCGTVDALREAAAAFGSRCGAEVVEARMLDGPPVDLSVRD